MGFLLNASFSLYGHLTFDSKHLTFKKSHGKVALKSLFENPDKLMELEQQLVKVIC